MGFETVIGVCKDRNAGSLTNDRLLEASGFVIHPDEDTPTSR